MKDQPGELEMASELALDHDERLADIVQRLAHELRPSRIYLFGSRARDEAAEDSDYDLMVLVPASEDPPHRRAQQAYGVLWGVGTPVDVLVWTEAEFQRQVPVVASLPATIIREGRLVYAA